jgi:hypothetical protein
MCSLLFYIYGIGALIFAIGFIVKVLILFYQIFTKPVTADQGFKVIELDRDQAPCSFGHYIFINTQKYDQQTSDLILLHEKIHVKQHHSIDLLLSELVLILQWFNPFAWLYRKEIKNNLEFLTDNTLLDTQGVDVSTYQLSLLKVCSNKFFSFTLNYNQSLLKKRIIMMNCNKSNSIRILKYPLLLPLLIILLCMFNDSEVFSNPTILKNNLKNLIMKTDTEKQLKGTWHASIENEGVHFQFMSDDNVSSSVDFKLNEFAPLPIHENKKFSLEREAGALFFEGKIENGRGNGSYSFTPKKQLIQSLNDLGVKTDNSNYFTIFLLNINHTMLQSLRNYGFKNINESDLFFVSMLQIAPSYIDMLKKEGYENLSLQQIIAGKNSGIDEQYIREIKSTHVAALTFDKLLRFKNQKLDHTYINSIATASGSNSIDADQVSLVKGLHIDPSYVTAMSRFGFNDFTKLMNLKALNITQDYIESFQKLGYSQVPYETLIMMKMSELTSNYINGFKELGYNNESLEDFNALKNLKIDTSYIKGLTKLGYKNVPLKQIMFLKLNHVTPEYISSVRVKGISFSDLNGFISLRYSTTN